MFSNTTKKQMYSFNTPIVLIVFNRTKYLEKIFEVLKKLKPKTLYIAADGPREEIKRDLKNCNLVRNLVLEKIDWDCKIYKKFREKNSGLKININEAIDWCFEQENECIILEDDCLPDISFFEFCKFTLNKYRQIKKIKMISGNYYFKNILSQNSYYFSNCPGTHGWAIWKDRWLENDKKMKSWNGLKEFFWLIYFFNFNISVAHYFYQKFKLSYLEEIKSWDYQLLFSIWKNNGLIIRPYKNLCKHIGWGPDSTHGKGDDTFPELKNSLMKFPIKSPHKIKINIKLDNLEHKHIRKIYFFRYLVKLIKLNFLKIFK